MSRLGLLFNLTPTEEQYIDVMLGKLNSLGVTYPTLSNIEVTDTPKIIEALMSKIRFAFLSEFSVYAMHNDFDFDLECLSMRFLHIVMVTIIVVGMQVQS